MDDRNREEVFEEVPRGISFVLKMEEYRYLKK